MKKRKRVIATGFPVPDWMDEEAILKSFVALRKRDEEYARRAEQEHSAAETTPAPVRKPARKVKRAADTAE